MKSLQQRRNPVREKTHIDHLISQASLYFQKTIYFSMRYIDSRDRATAGRICKGELSGNTANYDVTRVEVRRRPGNKRRLRYRKWLTLFP